MLKINDLLVTLLWILPTWVSEFINLDNIYKTGTLVASLAATLYYFKQLKKGKKHGHN